MKFLKTRTERGFQLITFEDNYSQKCSLQKCVTSSNKEQVWLGADEVTYDDADQPVNSRMGLTRAQSFKLAFKLLYFSIFGRLFFEKKDKDKNKKQYFRSMTII